MSRRIAFLDSRAVSFLTPLLGILAGAALLDEPLTWGLFAAVALVALGIRLVNLWPRNPA